MKIKKYIDKSCEFSMFYKQWDGTAKASTIQFVAGDQLLIEDKPGNHDILMFITYKDKVTKPEEFHLDAGDSILIDWYDPNKPVEEYSQTTDWDDWGDDL